jgi:hypothetical protein
MKDYVSILAVLPILPIALISPGLENVLYLAIGSAITAILGGIGYFIKRTVEQKPNLDALEVNERALRLLKELSTQNLSIEEFHARKEQILNPRKSLGRQDQRAWEQLAQVVSSEISATGEMLESFRWQFRVGIRLHKRLDQEEAVMFAALDALLDALYAKKGFSEAMDLIESQQAWRKCWPDYNVVTAKYEDKGVGAMFYHAEFAAVMSDRAAVLRSRLREVEESTVLPLSPDAPQLTP